MTKLAILTAALALAFTARADDPVLKLNEQEYLEMPGLNVMLAHDFYPEGHQGGVGIIQNGQRVATNGDLRLEATPGQWQPTPVVGPRQVDRATQTISVRMSYPDPLKNRTGFNPVPYPDLKFGYKVSVRPDGAAFRIVVDLDAPLPDAWVGRVGFNLELFPGLLFGRSYQIGEEFGTFPRQPDGPGAMTDDGYEMAPLGHGSKLTVAPESDAQRLTIESVQGGELVLLDGRAQHNNGWFVVRALVPKGASTHAVEWLVTPHAIPQWKAAPVIQVSQIGYHPKQPKIAVIEIDRSDDRVQPVAIYRADPAGNFEKIDAHPAKDWGRFLRYRYLQFDFSEIEQPGLYQIGYGDQRSAAFQIGEHVYERHVWQPTVEYFLAVQMCHMRVNDNYRVWHGLCHADDALMAPPNHNHFDGYAQGPSTLTKFAAGEHVPGLDRGGWHDAGDYDLRIESQADTVHGLALAWELFHPTLDNTTIDEDAQVVDIHRPDGKPDLLQQIEHGVLSIVGSYHSMGRLYRGIQDASLRQYTHLGDAHDMTDNQVFHDATGQAIKVLASAAENGSQAEPAIDHLPRLGSAGSADDRWVFTEDNPAHELGAAGALAAASRALKGYNDPLAADCLRIARELWARAKPPRWPLMRLEPAIELYQTTGEQQYADAIVALGDAIAASAQASAGPAGRFDSSGPAALAARSLSLIHNPAYTAKVRTALVAYRTRMDALVKETPYGLPYRPDIWGAGWMIERFGVNQYFLHTAAPDLFPATYLYRAIDFMLGCHPGANNASFVSGVGARSMIPAYGNNRADWSYIPGGVASGTALIRPDFPELLEWPYLWQQGEYCLGYPTSDWVFLVLAADHLLNHS